MPVLTEEKPNLIVPPPGGPGNGGGGDGDSGGVWPSFPVSKGQVGLWILLTGIMMLFAGLSSAYIVLRSDPAWQNITLPAILWTNTGVLVAASIALECARRAVRKDQLRSMNQWLVVAGFLAWDFSRARFLPGASLSTPVCICRRRYTVLSFTFSPEFTACTCLAESEGSDSCSVRRCMAASPF
jgi:hypothetical protein